MLGIKTKLSIFFPQIDGQTEWMNQELEQYLWFFVNHRQKNWPEWLATAEFAVNNKTYSVTKIYLFMANYGRKWRTGADIKRKEKVERVTEFAERMKKVQEKVGVTLRKAQEEMKQQADRGRIEVEEWKKSDKVMLSMKYLMFKERLAKKLVDWYVSLYIINKVIFH